MLITDAQVHIWLSADDLESIMGKALSEWLDWKA